MHEVRKFTKSKSGTFHEMVHFATFRLDFLAQCKLFVGGPVER